MTDPYAMNIWIHSYHQQKTQFCSFVSIYPEKYPIVTMRIIPATLIPYVEHNGSDARTLLRQVGIPFAMKSVSVLQFSIWGFPARLIWVPQNP